MKQLLFILIVFSLALKTPLAQETISNDDLSWSIIRSSFFGENYSKAFRYEKNIRIKLEGATTKRDSQIVMELINELKPLLETVSIHLVQENANFEIEFISSELPTPKNYYATWRYNGTEIERTRIFLTVPSGISYDSAKTYIRYFIVKHLTRRFSKNLAVSYTKEGILSQSPNFMNVTNFNFIDKDILQKLYSKDFYKNLRRNTTRKWGYLSYLYLRYENLLINLFLSLKIILVIFGFLHFLSNESKRVKHPTFLIYIKQRTLILLIIPFIFTFVTKTGNFQTPVIPSFGIFIANFVGVIIYAFFTILLIFHTERYVFKRITDFWQQQLFIFFNTILAIVFTYSILSIPFVFLNKSQSFSSLSAALLLNTQLLLLVILIAVLRVFYNLVSNRIQSMVNQKDVEIAKMKELKNQAELNALHSRINPHFLYNSLNSIASLAHINPDKTENMATALSELFRYSINKENKTFVSVSEELEMVKKYLEIEKTRFGDKLEYSIQAEDDVKETLIPKFVIQPLAENSIKHGLSKIKNTGKIIVEVKRLGNDLVITIFDNGPDFPKEPVSGYGLQNLHDKLDIIYGKDAFINWENGENKHFKITLKNQF